MFQNILKWVIKVGEKEIHVLLEPDTSTAIVKEVAYLMLKYCGSIEDAAAAQAAQQASEKPAEEKPTEPVQAPVAEA